MFLLYIAIFILLVITAGYLLKFLWHRYTSKYAFIYCPSNIPLFGSTLGLKTDTVEAFKQREEFLKEGNKLFVLWMLGKAVIFSAKIEHAQAILSGQQNIRKSYGYNLTQEWLSTGLLTSTGDKWKHRRRIITPAFHFSILNEFVPIFEKHALKLVDIFNIAANNLKPIEVQTPLSLMTLEAMCETSMGISNTTEHSNADYLDTISTMLQQLQFRVMAPWLWPRAIYKLTSYGKEFYKNLQQVHDYTINAINKRIAAKTKEETEHNNEEENKLEKKNVCFIDTLLQSYQNGDMDINGIREEVDTFVFAGHDTTSSGLSFCLFALGKHKEHQMKLQHEIDTTEGKNLLEIIQKIEFLDCVVKETFRLYPPAPKIGRSLDEDVVIDGRTYWKGTQFIISIVGIHRNEEYWENPLQFNPNRFMNNEISKRNPYCFIPFSAGPRNCIGQRFALLEVKIFLYHILKNFNITATQTEEELGVCTDLIIQAKHGIYIKFEKR